MPVSNSTQQIFMIFAILVILVAIVHMFSPVIVRNSFATNTNRERFVDKLMQPDDFVVYQGVSVPVNQPSNVMFDNHKSLPNVDGSSDSPRSMFMMSFNKCDPSCCPSTYSCSGGCVCMTDKQKDFLGKRGNNSASRCKTKDNIEY